MQSCWSGALLKAYQLFCFSVRASGINLQMEHTEIFIYRLNVLMQKNKPADDL